MNDIRKITIFIGEIGSGKTEISINYAIKLKKERDKDVDLIDLDIMKPYIRLRDLKDEIKKFGVNVVSPPQRYKQADLPILIHATKSCIFDDNRFCIYDIGGGEESSFVLRQFPELREFPYNLFFVVNIFRPFTQTKEEIENAIKILESASDLKVSGIVSNTHLREYTKKDDVVKGYKVVKEVSKVLDIPIAFVGVKESMVDEFRDEDFYEYIFPMKTFIKYPGER